MERERQRHRDSETHRVGAGREERLAKILK